MQPVVIGQIETCVTLVTHFDHELVSVSTTFSLGQIDHPSVLSSVCSLSENNAFPNHSHTWITLRIIFRQTNRHGCTATSICYRVLPPRRLA